MNVNDLTLVKLGHDAVAIRKHSEDHTQHTVHSVQQPEVPDYIKFSGEDCESILIHNDSRVRKAHVKGNGVEQNVQQPEENVLKPKVHLLEQLARCSASFVITYIDLLS